MFLDFNAFFKGLKNSKYLVISFVEDTKLVFTLLKIMFKQKAIIYEIKSNLICNPIYIRENYIFVQYNHLEINPFIGIFLQDTHRLLDIYPNITFVDKIKSNLDDLGAIFATSLCLLEYKEFNLSTNLLTLDEKYDSISLNFAIDEIKGGITEIHNFIAYLRSVLNPGGIIFGVTVLGGETYHKPKAQKYINKKNDAKLWFNKKTTEKDIEEIFLTYFDDILIDTIGSCTVFRCALKQYTKDVMPHKLDIETVGNKYILIK